MPWVEIRCPNCNQTKNIEILNEQLKDISSGVIAINILENIVCPHSFIVYVDRNMDVRDYFIADFQVEIPQIPPSRKLKDISIPSIKDVDMNLIRLNLPAMFIVHVLKSIFSNCKIAIISHSPDLDKHILNFFRNITKDRFKVNLVIISKEDYNSNKKKFKSYMIFEDFKIHNNFNNLIDSKRLKVEKQIVNNFLTETNLGLSYIVLKNEIHKAYLLAKSIAEFAKNFRNINPDSQRKQNKNLIFKDIIENVIDKRKYVLDVISEYFKKKFDIKADKTYLNFLIEIVDNYFAINLNNMIKITH